MFKKEKYIKEIKKKGFSLGTFKQMFEKHGGKMEDGFDKIVSKFVDQISDEKKILESDLYYNDVNEIPLYNWWKCSKGELQYLWKKRVNQIPSFFKGVFESMYFQFDYIELDGLRKNTHALYYENKYLTTKNIKWKRKADTMRAEAELISKKQDKETKLNDLIRFVQDVLKISYYLDATKISAGYFFNLYAEAKRVIESHGNSKN